MCCCTLATGCVLVHALPQEYRDWATRVDTDGDEAVSAEEFRAMLEQSETFDFLSELFKTFDKMSLEKKLVTVKDPDETKTDVDLIMTENEDADEDLLQGDILPDTESPFRSAVRNERKKWPQGADGIVVIPYVIINQTDFLETQVNLIEAVMEEFAARTCLHFVPRTDQSSYIQIKMWRTCSSGIGRKEGPQTVNLREGCANRKGSIQHELMHRIGFLHEQERADRDKYITILWDNIQGGSSNANFKLSGKRYTTLGLPYDTQSVMHYGPRAASINGKKTIVSKDPTKKIGRSKGWTDLDVLKVNTLYKCDATVTGEPIAKWQGTTELTPTHAGKQTTPRDTMSTSVTMSTVPLEMTTDETTTATRVRATRVVCTFDEDLCGFTEGTSDDFNWSWSQEGKGTPSRRTGPKSDHTIGHGRFLFIEANKKAPGKKAHGLSPVYSTTGPHCLTFYYSMKGQGIGSLNVYLRTVGMGTNDDRKLWSRSGPQGNKWSKAEVTFTTAANFQVIFEGVRGTSAQGDIAIDDMILDTGPCA